MNLPSSTVSTPGLERGLGVVEATALNIANMVGIGPFITIPLFLSKMGGPQALIGWVVAALVVLCDGLVWSELGAALPGSGGTYHFLARIFGKSGWGRLLPFLFIWQFLFTGALEMASGYIGAIAYLVHAIPKLDQTLASWHVPGGTSTLAAAAALVVMAALCRSIQSIGRWGVVLCAGTLLTMLAVIISGLANFDSTLIVVPDRAFHVDSAFLHGLGGAMAIAVYDYLGYYNICHLGDEVVDPGRTIPRAVMISIGVVGTMYLTMNTAIIGVIPWSEAVKSTAVVSDFMAILYGRGAAQAFTLFILWTVVASTFALLLGYSRIPFAAARDGGFFRAFAVVHPVHKYPVVSLLSLGALTAAFCYLPLGAVIDAAVTVRIVAQFIVQIIALHVLRTTRPDLSLPFRMWLYPLPSLVALAGWIFIVATSEPLFLWITLGVLVSGCIAYPLWQLAQRPKSGSHAA